MLRMWEFTFLLWTLHVEMGACAIVTCLHKTPGLPSISHWLWQPRSTIPKHKGSSTALLRLSELTSGTDLSLYMLKQEESSSIIPTEIFYQMRIQSWLVQTETSIFRFYQTLIWSLHSTHTQTEPLAEETERYTPSRSWEPSRLNTFVFSPFWQAASLRPFVCSSSWPTPPCIMQGGKC